MRRVLFSLAVLFAGCGQRSATNARWWDGDRGGLPIVTLNPSSDSCIFNTRRGVIQGDEWLCHLPDGPRFLVRVQVVSEDVRVDKGK